MGRWAAAIGVVSGMGGMLGCGLPIEGTTSVSDAAAGPAGSDAGLADDGGKASDGAATSSPLDAGVDPSAPATVRDYCEKCASCIQREPGFADSFCEPHKKAGAFDLASCEANPSLNELGARVSKGVLAGWTCRQFDNKQ